MFDAQERYRFNNKKYEEWYGISATEIYGKHIKEFVGESMYETVRPYIETVLSGETVTYETKILAPDGTIRDVHVSYVPQFSQGGEVAGFVALINDITESKQSQKLCNRVKNAFANLQKKCGLFLGKLMLILEIYLCWATN
ncbi:MAG: PAS domain-containing protein [Scytonema sp. CRU_2_7]|nr:PAS domain-containing protein [Scytonema sp. CRU_2_7]